MYASSFRNYFTPLVGVLFTFPSRYLFTIGRMRVLRLGEWSPHVQTEFHVFRLTQGYIIALPVRGYHPLRPCFPDRFRLSLMYHWPGPRSLATTNGVSVDVLSSGYLDVSVPRVRLKPPMYSGVLSLHVITEVRNQALLSQCAVLGRVRAPRAFRFVHLSRMDSEFRYRRWVSPFGYPRIKAPSQLLAAFRSVARPSSPLSAKASTKCPYFT